LYFNETDNWTLELYYFGVDPGIMGFDSVFFLSSTDTVQYTGNNFQYEEGYLALNENNLDEYFNLNRYGDALKIRWYSMDMMFEDGLIYGNMPEAVISYPRNGQSLSYYNAYVKDKSPTLGLPNDTIGCMGTLSGVVYDLNNIPIPNRTFNFEINSFTTNTFGQYSTRVLSKHTSLNWLLYYDDQTLRYCSTEPIIYAMEPDSAVIADFYLLDTLWVGLNKKETANNSLRLYPNPVSKTGYLKYEIDLPYKSTDLRIELLTVDGKLLWSEKINNATGRINISYEAGVYILYFRMANTILASEMILITE
jgi:hypothetical protein